ncbi:YqaA family protein [Anaeromicrobium sediminis]|nr:VTT domain-containing protein [Anaeromicrobium sediminis]
MSYIINILINYGVIGIMIAAFFEPILMPVPMEFVSIPIALLNQDKALLYSIILILFSALGSTVGYYIGKFLSGTLLNKFVSAENVSKLKNLYEKNSFLTILTSAFTPIPYEAYVLSAGIFNIGFTKFIMAALISRCIRHLPQGIIISLYGDVFLGNLKNYTMIMGLIIFIIILLLRYLFRKNNSNTQ